MVVPLLISGGGVNLSVGIFRQVRRVFLRLPASVRLGELRQRVEAGDRPPARQESPFLQQRDALVRAGTTKHRS